MLYPFVYTRTRFHDYRLLTSKALIEIPKLVLDAFVDTARSMIDAEYEHLKVPSWILMTYDNYLLWGIAVANEILGDEYRDKNNRPVRGFFGLISDTSIDKLPYDISYFREMYSEYILPLWNSFEQTKEITDPLPTIGDIMCITKSSRRIHEINLDEDKCRVFPFESDCASLIEATFTSSKPCSIATNVPKKSNCIEYGREKYSFMNIIMASNYEGNSTEDIQVFVKEKSQSKEAQFPNEGNVVEERFCLKCGKTIYDKGSDKGSLCEECQSKEGFRRDIKIAFYFIVLLCFVIWIAKKIWLKEFIGS